MTLDEPFFRRAFQACGEKHYGLARLFYPRLLGRDWHYCLLGFAYLKCLDDLVDEDADPDRALAAMKQQRQLIERIYAGWDGEPLPPAPESYAVHFFRWDRERGAPLRAGMEVVLDRMAFDLGRRGMAFPRHELDAHLVAMGSALVDYLSHFTHGPGTRLPDAVRETGSLAYLHADNLIDLEHDLAQGVINIPLEDLDAYSIDPLVAGDAAVLWRIDRRPRVEAWFEESIGATRGGGLSLRVFGRLLLERKRRELGRALDGPPGSPSAAPPG